jgi:hypothetical protein
MDQAFFAERPQDQFRVVGVVFDQQDVDVGGEFRKGSGCHEIVSHII